MPSPNSIPIFLTLLPSLLLLQTTPSSSTTTTTHCTAFPTTPQPPYPFSTQPGSGHPSFHLHCTPTHTLITINNFTFSLLHYDSTSYTLTLSPQPHFQICPSLFTHIPTLPFNFTNTPFRMSDSTCSRIFLLKPCTHTRTKKCTLCPWECSLVTRPFRILDTVCESGGAYNNSDIPEQGCQSDVLGYLDYVLKMGVLVEFDFVNDKYFSSCRNCKQVYNGVCGYNDTDPQKPFKCIQSNVSEVVFTPRDSGWIRKHKERVRLAILILVVICLISLLALTYFVVQKNKRVFTSNIGSLEDPTTMFLHRHRCASLLPPVFTYEELEASTNRFNLNRKIGGGGFGSVYLGHLLDGRVVAVKYLHNRNNKVGGGIPFSSKSFCNEILILSSIDHPNLVKLHGYCSDPRGLLLVYDYISNGTLADHLHGTNRKISGPLSWVTRVDIALQVSIAIEYLHFMVEPPVVHRDITTSNIFVDETMRVRLGDFGLSRLLVYPENRSLSGELSGFPSASGCIWTGPQGTPGYLDPDYYKSFRLTEKSDVYSFGVILLELITGLKAVDQRREKRDVTLVDMVVVKIQLGVLDQVVDPSLAAEEESMEESVAAVAELAFRCVAADKDDRPDAKEVVTELRRVWTLARGVRGCNANVVVVPSGSET